MTVPTGTALSSATYPHRAYHGYPDSIQFVYAGGSDSNDGLTWGTAKLTLLAAYDAIATKGDIYLGGTSVAVGGEVASQGLWIAGTADSAYASVPSGWRQQKAVRIIGVGARESASFARTQVGLNAGSTTDRDKPALWINGTNVPLVFENIHFRYPAVAAKLGIDSTTGSRAGNTSGMWFRNCGFELNQVAGNGPTIDAGNFYWTFFEGCSLSSNAAAYTLTAATITGGTTAQFTTSVTHAFAVGDTVDVRSVTPTAYNSPVAPGWTVTAVGATSFDADIGSSPTDGTVFGVVRGVEHSRRAVIYAPSLTTFTMTDSMMSGGGIYLGAAGPAPTSVQLRNVLLEGAWGTYHGPPLYFVKTSLGSQANHVLDAISQADSSIEATVKVPVTQDPKRIVVSNSYVKIKGPVTQFGNTIAVDGPPSAGRGLGIWQGRLYGQTDAARRGFPPTAVRFVNIADQNTANWGAKTGSATVTTGKTAPDGSSLAAELSSASGNQSRRVASANYTLAVGDWAVAGCWVRRASSPVDAGTDAAMLSIGAPHSDNVFEGSGINNVYGRHPLGTAADGGGEWYWVSVVDKFATVGTATSSIRLELGVEANCPIWFFAPVCFRIAAGTIPDNEVWDYVTHMQTWPDTAAAGTITTLRGQKLIAWAGLGVGNSAAATEILGTSNQACVKKIEVFDETGTSLGYIPVYAALS